LPFAADREIVGVDRLRPRAVSRSSVAAAALIVFFAALALSAPPAHAEGRVLLGVYGDIKGFERLTGQRSSIGLRFLSWDQGQLWEKRDPAFLDEYGTRPMIALTMSKNGIPYLTPRQVARGRGDAHLIGIARTAARSGKKVFVRPYAEMNGSWNNYSAYNADGSRRGAPYRHNWLKQAFRRTYIIMHGGSGASMSARLKALGLPGVRRDVPANPYPNMTVVWNPQGQGSPNIPGNMPRAYWPGGRYVDMVANDLYTRTGVMSWANNERLYRAYPGKPYGIGEWGIGIDAPSAVREMARFASTHRRVKLLVFFNGDPGSAWKLGQKPRSLAAYKRYIVPLGR
jgi:hypothetical protein